MVLVPVRWVFDLKTQKQPLHMRLNSGATPFNDCKHADHGLPAIEAIGGSVIYFVDDKHQPFQNHWQTTNQATDKDCGLALSIISPTMSIAAIWINGRHFYESIFNFREIRFFNIVGKMTGLVSRALVKSLR